MIPVSERKACTCGFPIFSVEGSAQCFLSFNMYVLYSFPRSCCFTQEQLYLLMADMQGVDPN